MPAARTLITVAPTGAETAKADAPGLPVTLEELVEQAVACQAAGAALVHVHIRDDDAAPTLDLGRLRDTVAALRESTDLVVQLSTGGSVHDPLEDRLRVLDAAPDSCSLTCGTVNFGADVFLNPWPFMVRLHEKARDLEVVPEYELFDLGHVTAMNRLLDKHGLPYGGHVHCDLVMGVPGGMPGTAEALVAAVRALPEGASWSATGVGRTTLAVALAALSAGGHLRVGMEDTLTYAPGEQVGSNVPLVERAAALATLAQRPPMTPQEAREMLHVKDRRTGGAPTVPAHASQSDPDGGAR
ncbi:MAG: 3-keto-5-aminohexanoate cleavage protein [Motilibacteraceae bacterium]